jgi:hypothetical protein
VVERGGLENRCSGNPATEGSNPSPSAQPMILSSHRDFSSDCWRARGWSLPLLARLFDPQRVCQPAPASNGFMCPLYLPVRQFYSPAALPVRPASVARAAAGSSHRTQRFPGLRTCASRRRGCSSESVPCPAVGEPGDIRLRDCEARSLRRGGPHQRSVLEDDEPALDLPARLGQGV